MKTIIVFDASQYAEWLVCPTKWKYHYNENLRLAEASVEAMNKGTLVHSLLDSYYRLLAFDPNGSFTHVEHAWNTFEETGDTEKLGIHKEFNIFLKKRFIDYIMFYQNRDFHPVVKNNKPSIELGFSKILLETDEFMFITEGRIDLVEYKDKFLFWDHKSQEVFANLYQYTPQMLTYAWATNYEYGGVNYFGLQKEVNANTFRRQIIHFPKWMIKRWEAKMIEICYEVAESLKTGVFKMNQDSCGGPMNKYPCAYTHLDEVENAEMRENIKAFKYKKTEHWRAWA